MDRGQHRKTTDRFLSPTPQRVNSVPVVCGLTHHRRFSLYQTHSRLLFRFSLWSLEEKPAFIDWSDLIASVSLHTGDEITNVSFHHKEDQVLLGFTLTLLPEMNVGSSFCLMVYSVLTVSHMLHRTKHVETSCGGGGCWPTGRTTPLFYKHTASPPRGFHFPLSHWWQWPSVTSIKNWTDSTLNPTSKKFFLQLMWRERANQSSTILMFNYQLQQTKI